MNEKHLQLLNITPEQLGGSVCVVDESFSGKSIPGIIAVNFDPTQKARPDKPHGTSVVLTIREICQPKEIHCFASGWTNLDNAVRYCAERGIKLINCSLTDARLSQESIALCLQHNILIIKSAGNRAEKGVTRPAEVDSCVLAVAAYEPHSGRIDADSSIGPEVDCAAPTNWEVKLWNGFVITLPDTSGAAPAITAVLSKYLITNPDATIAEMKNFILSNCRPLPGVPREKQGAGLFRWPDTMPIEPEKEDDTVNWKEIILHHTVTTVTAEVEEIRQMHIQRGFSDVGYHFLVDFRGRVYPGRPLTMPGAHTVDHNYTAIGIAGIGNFDVFEMAKEQREGIVTLVRQLIEQYNIPVSNVMLHKDVAATACPGKLFPMAEIKAGIVHVPGPYPDVPGDHWAAPFVDACKKAGLMNGFSDGKFWGDRPLSRYEFAKVMAVALKLPE